MTNNLKGAVFIILSCGFIAATSAIAKQLGPEGGAGLHPLQVSFGRFLFGFLTLLPIALITRPTFSGTKWTLHVSRSIFGWAGVSSMFAAVALMPLAEATAISFLSPFFTMILAILFLGERAGPWRWGAAAVAFTGVLILTQPGTSAFQPSALIALMAAMFMGAELTLIKRLTGTEPLLRILLINNFIGTVISGCAAYAFWEPVSMPQWGMLAAIGIIMVTAQSLFVRGMRLGEANYVAPFMYTTLLYAALYGVLFFGEMPSAPTFGGAALILTGAAVLGWRERRAAVKEPVAIPFPDR
ncbi:DMT family transporter [Hwanghaeella grinnelliae]|uniref:DMT family transporter n=1 Tax=Hwanghaeella grinnelliae TaxID=2500179 RepID=A0A437QTZ6_9PROT|nr:DMT family transporter [Hwanghaeella grinnelliae]RVU37959.1 DMT family transporter [Hwanghaeella grinnelliae]